VRPELVQTRPQLERWCGKLAASTQIALDTEFISERTYRTQLCLVQLALPDGTAVLVDPLAIGDLRPLWELLADGGHETVVHAGREEVMFSLEAVGRPPARLFDVQLAAGMIGMQYPAGYRNLVTQLLEVSPRKGETRSDWSQRPLTSHQLAYAVEDVRYLIPLRNLLHERLVRLERVAWLEEETTAWLAELAEARGRERWRRLTGGAGLSPRAQAIVRELWHWREAEAAARNRPAKTVLRDDLIVELARRGTADPSQIQALRGMERRDLRPLIPDLAAAIERALLLPQTDLPHPPPRFDNSQFTLLGQLLSSALGSVCRNAQIAPSLVGTANDVRAFIAWRLGESDPQYPPPLLTQGWRAQVVGRVLDDLLAGKLAIRVRDPRSDTPLEIQPLPEA
jgi:ribonuclease D